MVGRVNCVSDCESFAQVYVSEHPSFLLVCDLLNTQEGALDKETSFEHDSTSESPDLTSISMLGHDIVIILHQYLLQKGHSNG